MCSFISLNLAILSLVNKKVHRSQSIKDMMNRNSIEKEMHCRWCTNMSFIVILNKNHFLLTFYANYTKNWQPDDSTDWATTLSLSHACKFFASKMFHIQCIQTGFIKFTSAPVNQIRFQCFPSYLHRFEDGMQSFMEK